MKNFFFFLSYDAFCPMDLLSCYNSEEDFATFPKSSLDYLNSGVLWIVVS